MNHGGGDVAMSDIKGLGDDVRAHSSTVRPVG